MKDERVGMRLEPENKELGLCRITVVTASRNAASDLGRNLKCKNVRALRVNNIVRAIFQEIQSAPQEPRMMVDGVSNLWPKQRRALEDIGLTLMTNGCQMTGVLRWEHARVLAAMRLF